jgi:hypothetical protein
VHGAVPYWYFTLSTRVRAMLRALMATRATTL